MESPPPLEYRYTCRASVLEKEQTWVLQPNRLGLGQPDGLFQEILLRDVRQLRLSHTPTRYVGNYYRCELLLANGAKFEFRNHSFMGFANFEDRSAAYRIMVYALISRLREQQAQCQFRVGVSSTSWWLNLLFFSVIMVVLLALLLVMWVSVGWLVVLKLLLIAIFVPRAIGWFRKNRPMLFDPTTVPEHALPREP